MASLVKESLAVSWRASGVRIYVETADEAALIAAAVRCSMNEIAVTGTEVHPVRTLET